MANLVRKDGIFNVRFRFQGKDYKRSLKTRDRADAEAAQRSVEQVIHRLLTGLIQLPSDVEAGDFILSGGTRLQPPATVDKPKLPSTQVLIEDYLKSHEHKLAPSYHGLQKIHLGHFERFLGTASQSPCDRVSCRDLDHFLQKRLAIRSATTANKERITLIQFYKWATAQQYLDDSPAAALPAIKGGSDRPPFRTSDEIHRILDRGGLTEAEQLDLWECLYLKPAEIASLLAIVRANASQDVSYLLHAIPAYTGMRRGEVLRARWLDVDLVEGYIIARSRKQSRLQQETQRRIDLHPELKTELEAWRQQRPKGQYLLCDFKTLEPLAPDRANRDFWQPMRGTDWALHKSKSWYKIGFHSYRHSFASNLAAAGVDQRIIDEFMGHQTDAMRRRYRHLFPENRRLAIESFSLAVNNGEMQTTAPVNTNGEGAGL